ncbi:hypothetical protein SKA34_12585 [Photobacterium sp. SKA34]|uniref:hypothetical protein n=1 Tax=Photobacterium sp. SKA34 TaxID=121723 RepID=UPI00006B41A0|nr:hypothetical protein [Photobacterium sp. SKA34]EAR56729.1 hypothetical protein SKA34_12585 [Photobacterium sp. SKA34]
MSKLHISQVESGCERFLKLMQIGDAFEVLTFKKDRGFKVLKHSSTDYVFKQFGYMDKNIITESSVLKKHIKKAIKTEFPRSNMAWIEHFYGVDSIDKLSKNRQTQYHLF